MLSSRERGLSKNGACRVASSVLANAALARGSRDNVTVIVIDVEPHAMEADGLKHVMHNSTSSIDLIPSGAEEAEAANGTSGGACVGARLLLRADVSGDVAQPLSDSVRRLNLSHGDLRDMSMATCDGSFRQEVQRCSSSTSQRSRLQQTVYRITRGSTEEGASVSDYCVLDSPVQVQKLPMCNSTGRPPRTPSQTSAGADALRTHNSLGGKGMPLNLCPAASVPLHDVCDSADSPHGPLAHGMMMPYISTDQIMATPRGSGELVLAAKPMHVS